MTDRAHPLTRAATHHDKERKNMSQQDKLTIAQALRRSKKLKGQIAEHQARATNGVSYDVKKIPAFKYKESADAMFALQDEVVDLETKVAVANATHTIETKEGPVPLARAVRTLQELKGKITFLKSLTLRNEVVVERNADWDSDSMQRITRTTETTFQSDLSEQDRDRLVKSLQDTFEALNNKVEAANHTVTV